MTDYQEYDAPERFVIDSDRKAEWALKRIKEIMAEEEKWVEWYETKIADVNADCEDAILHFAELLRQYFMTLEEKRETKTQFSYELPSGKLVLKKSKSDFKITDEDKFTATVAERLPELMKTKTVSKPDWAEIKKRLIRNGAAVYVTDDGEIIRLDGVELVETPEKFEVK